MNGHIHPPILDQNMRWLDEFAKATVAHKQGLKRSVSPRLLERPKRHSDESRQHHLMRIAEDNCLAGIKDLGLVLGLKPGDLMMFEEDALAQFLRGIQFDELSPPLRRDAASTILVRRRLWTRARVCPQCIREQEVTPAYFDYCLSLRCDLHQLQLIDRCPRCESALSYLRKRLSHCDCGQPLRELPAIAADSMIDLFHCIFAPWRLNKDWFRDEKKVLGLEVNSAMTLNALLKAALSETDNRKRSQPWLYFEDWPVVRSLISPWPDALDDYLKTIMEDLTPLQSGDLLKHLSTPELPVLNEIAVLIRIRQIAQRKARLLLNIGTHGVWMVALAQIRDIAKLDAEAVSISVQI